MNDDIDTSNGNNSNDNNSNDSTNNASITPDSADVISIQKQSEAKRHAQKEQRFKKMQKAFENYRPIDKDSRQVRRRKARKNRKGKKK